jgi:hypothetical protein
LVCFGLIFINFFALCFVGKLRLIQRKEIFKNDVDEFVARLISHPVQLLFFRRLVILKKVVVYDAIDELCFADERLADDCDAVGLPNEVNVLLIVFEKFLFMLIVFDFLLFI